MEPGTFRHRLAEFAAEINAIAPLSALGFSRSVRPHRTSFTYWYPLGFGAQMAEGSGAETAESLLRFFGAARVLTLPLPECALPTSAWLGFGSSAPLSDAQAAAVDAVTRRAAAVLDGDEPLDSKLDRLRRLEAAAEMVTALTDALDVRDVFDRVATIAKSVLEHDALSLRLFSDDLSRATHLASSGVDDQREAPNPYPLHLTSVFDYLIIDDAAALPTETEQPGLAMGFRSSLRLAIRLGGRLIGSLDFMSLAPLKYSSTDVAVGRRIAHHVALALSHHRLAEEARLNEELRKRGVEATRRADEATARVKQLESRVRQLTDELDARTGTSGHLSLNSAVALSQSQAVGAQPPAGAVPVVPPVRKREDLKSVERAMIEEALQNARFNKSKAAKELGLSRHQLYVRLRRHGLE